MNDKRDDILALGDRLIATKHDDGANWLIAIVPDEGEGYDYTITTNCVHASDFCQSNETLANLLAASLTLYQASVLALNAIQSARPDNVPLTAEEREAMRWLKSGIAYAETGEWHEPDLPRIPAQPLSNAPMLGSKIK